MYNNSLRSNYILIVNKTLRKVLEMPNITIEAAQLAKETKMELIRSITKTASEITSIPESSFTLLIKEYPMENWGIGGETLEEIIKKRG